MDGVGQEREIIPDRFHQMDTHGHMGPPLSLSVLCLKKKTLAEWIDAKQQQQQCPSAPVVQNPKHTYNDGQWRHPTVHPSRLWSLDSV